MSCFQLNCLQYSMHFNLWHVFLPLRRTDFQMPERYTSTVCFLSPLKQLRTWQTHEKYISIKPFCLCDVSWLVLTFSVGCIFITMSNQQFISTSEWIWYSGNGFSLSLPSCCNKVCHSWGQIFVVRHLMVILLWIFDLNISSLLEICNHLGNTSSRNLIMYLFIYPIECSQYHNIAAISREIFLLRGSCILVERNRQWIDQKLIGIGIQYFNTVITEQELSRVIRVTTIDRR